MKNKLKSVIHDVSYLFISALLFRVVQHGTAAMCQSNSFPGNLYFHNKVLLQSVFVKAISQEIGNQSLL